MLNGIDPIIIFNFYKLNDSEVNTLKSIPLLGSSIEKTKLAPIPVYLSEKATGIYIDSEDKNIDIQTNSETTVNGSTPSHNQTGINSSITINMQASSNSLGAVLIAALCDVAYQKATSQEYSISYFHRGIVLFEALLKSFSITQNASDDRFFITLTLDKTTVDSKPKTGDNIPLVGNSGVGVRPL